MVENNNINQIDNLTISIANNKLNKYKCREKNILVYCDCCGKEKLIHRQEAQRKLRVNGKHFFCNSFCFGQYNLLHNSIKTNCSFCGKLITIQKCHRQSSKSGNSYCSQSCSAKYNNSHKTNGTRRSKFEKWLEIKLKNLYPKQQIEFNLSHRIGYELDIFFPLLNLGFEINGIFHYKPIYGQKKLQHIVEIDNKKQNQCLVFGIELVTINISSIIHFNQIEAEKFLPIIIENINKKISG